MNKPLAIPHCGRFALAMPRAIQSIRADAADPKAMILALNQAFEEFKTENDKKIDALGADKLAKIGEDMTAMTKTIEQLQATVAAGRLGGGGVDPNAAEHAKAFDRFFRKGVTDGLADLEVKAALTTQSDPDGGYLVPSETSKVIDRVLGTVSVMRELATVMPIGTDEYKKIVSQGGAGSGWVGEEEARPETTTPTLKELLFTVMEMYANPMTTQRMLDDGIVDIAAWLADEVQIQFAEQEGSAFVAGNGNKKPRGILSYTNVANASYAWGSIGYVPSGHASTFLTPTSTASPGDAFVDLYHSLKQGYRNNASWLMSDATLGTMRKFKDGQGNYLWLPPQAVEGPSTIMGKPVKTDDNMTAVGANAYPIAFADFKRAYLILDRLGIRVLRDPYTNKPYVSFYTTKRVGGGVANFEAIKLMKIATS